MTLSEESIQVLQTVGFSELEAAIYTFLLQESPATGYKIAHAIGKPISNTYKAINALQDKGAILVDEAESRLCRAVHPAELLGQMQQALKQRCERVSETLAQLNSPQEDERVYRLHTREQVIERAKLMLGRCRQVALIIAFPHILEELKADLETAVRRGIGVLIKAYRPIEVTGAQIILSNEADLMLENLPGQEIDLVCDAEEHLIALLERDGRKVVQAIWSGSPFLSYIHYNNLYNEWDLTRLNGLILAGATVESLRVTLLHRDFPLLETPGYHKLIRHLQTRVFGDLTRGSET